MMPVTDRVSPEPYSSVAAIRTTHAALLKRSTEKQDAVGLVHDVNEFLIRAAETGVLLDDESDRWAVQGILDYWLTILLRAGRNAPVTTLAEFDPSQAPTLDDAVCPYVGLNAFEERDAQKFFGRKRFVDQIVAAVETHSIVAILGPSGSGKSSVVRSGVIPRLARGAGSEKTAWQLLGPIVPGSDPLAALARAVLAHTGGTADPRSMADAFLRDGGALARLADATGRPLLLLVDQFEEIFTLCEDDALRQAFAEQVVGLTRAAQPHRVVICMRSDFESFLTRMPDLYAQIEGTILRPTPMSAAELREAIEAPAANVGLKFEAGVVDRLLADTLGEPAALPLLQFTLLKLWQLRDHNRVTLDAYNRLGGGRLALQRSADRFFDALLPQEQIATRRILMRIVRPGSGLEFTSSRVRRASLFTPEEAAGIPGQVLQKLIDEHLVRVTAGDRPDDDQVEVAHEALVRNWERLVQWLEEERQEIAIRRRLELKAAEWVRLGSATGGLLDEAQLVEAERWIGSAAAMTLGFDPSVAALVKASRTAIETEKQRAELAHRREIDTARELLEAAQTRAREREQDAKKLSRQRKVLVVLLLFAAAALAVAGTLFMRADRLNDDLQESIRLLNLKEGELKAKISELERAERDRDAARTANTTYGERIGSAPVTDEAMILRERLHPIRPGASIGQTSGATGTLCCVVEDQAGTPHLLSMRFVFGSETGSIIVQPGPGDGNAAAQVGRVVRAGADEMRSATIAALLDGVSAINDIPGHPALTGTLDDVPVGTPVWFIGRGSGLKAVRVQGVQQDREHGTEDIVLDQDSAPGDAGAPVFTAEGRLVGVLWGGDGRRAFVVPARQILSELGVRLIGDRAPIPRRR